MNRIRTLMFAAGVICLAMASVPADDPPEEGGGCSQGCHLDQYWKIGTKCVKADILTCCTVAWGVAVGGQRNNIGADVDHYSYASSSCVAYCEDKTDSAANPFATTGAPVWYGSWPECRCVPN